MPFTYFDIALAVIMLISGLLALMRGFTREMLALLTWGGAAAIGIFVSFIPEAQAFTRQFINHELGAQIALGVGAFLIALIIFSILTMRLADWVLDSGVGAIDRTLGFLFGLARGLLLVAVAYMFYIWWVPPEKSPPWIQNAKSLPVIDETSKVVMQILPPDVAEVLFNKTLSERRKNTDGNAPATQQNTIGGGNITDSQNQEGYNNIQRQDLNQTLQGQENQ